MASSACDVFQPANILQSQADEKGAFTLSAPPGNYLVVAWRQSDGPSALIAAIKRAESEQPNGITLAENEKKEIEIRLP